MSTSGSTGLLRLVGTVAVAAVALGACGGSDDEARSPATTERTTTVEATAAPATTAAEAEAETTTAETTTTTESTAESTVPTTRPRAMKEWTALRPGDCLVAIPTATFTTVDTIDCSEPHAGEFVGDRITMGDGAATCAEAFAAYADRTPEAAGSVLTWIEPVPTGGIDINAGRVWCIASPIGGSTAITGSIRTA